MADTFYEEDFFQPGTQEEQYFSEGVYIRSYRHTRWGLEAVAPYSTLVAQRIGNDQSLRFKPNSFSSSLVMAGNVSNQTIIGGFPADWPASGSIVTYDGNSVPAQIASATFYDLAYIALSVNASANANAVGGFVGLFTGDVILKCSDWSDWYTVSYNTNNDTVYYDDDSGYVDPSDPDWDKWFN